MEGLDTLQRQIGQRHLDSATPYAYQPRRECVQRLVLVLAHVRREKRRLRKALSKHGNADARLDSDIALATVRFRKDCAAALERWAHAKGIS